MRRNSCARCLRTNLTINFTERERERERAHKQSHDANVQAYEWVRHQVLPVASQNALKLGNVAGLVCVYELRDGLYLGHVLVAA